MKKINKNIAFDYDNVVKIEKYAKDNNKTFTATVNEIISKSSLNEDEIIYRIDKNSKNAKALISLTYELLKQLYSDLSFPKLTNIKDSKTLNDFLKKGKNIDN